MSDFLTLVQQLQREVGVAGSPVTTVTGQTSLYKSLVNWIADADIYIQAMHIDWKFLWKEFSIATTMGPSGAEPTIPSDLNIWDRESFYIDYTLKTNRRLREVDYKSWKNGRGRGVQVSRKPDSISFKPNNQIVLISQPDASYVLTGSYWMNPVKMVENIDISIIPEMFHRIIVIQAKLWYAEEQEMPTVYKAAYLELHGDGRKDIGLLGRLEAIQLPSQDRRNMGVAREITIRPE